MAFNASVNLYGIDYVVHMSKTKNKTNWYLLHNRHILDRSKAYGERLEYPILTDFNFNKNKEIPDLSNYLVEHISCLYNAPVKYYQGYQLLTEIIEDFRMAKTYGYSKDEVEEKDFGKFGKKIYKRAVESRYEEHYINGNLSDFVFFWNGKDYKFNTCKGRRFPKMILEDIPFMNNAGEFNSFQLLNIEDVSFEEIVDRYGDKLGDLVDRETGKIAKDYFPVSTIQDFETKVMNEIIKTINDSIANPRMDGTKHITSLDTETTGLLFNYIPEKFRKKVSNDHAVSLQLSWEFNKAACIYTDMEYFDNLSNDYVMKRLSELFAWPENEVIEFKQWYSNEGIKLDVPIIHRVRRADYWLANHNIMFDSKVLKSHGYDIYFDIDTLQMAFTLNPVEFKAKKDLKSLVYKLLGVSYPTLSDILGKGNEDKFKFIKDERVALLYGCCDVDLQRRVFYKLKSIMDDVSNRLFKAYFSIDSYTNNVLAEMEYYGVRVSKDELALKAEAVAGDLKTIEDLVYRFVGRKLYQRAQKIAGEPVDVKEMNRQKYVFNLAGSEVKNVVYKYLQYPVMVYTKTGEPALNSGAIKKLLKVTLGESSGELEEDIPSKLHPKEPLISKSEFNKYKYPLAYLLKEWKLLKKEYDAYYKPFTSKDNVVDRLYRPVKGANIETRRTSSALQIVKKSVKETILSHEEDWNLFDFDMAQIEARVMSSLANDAVMIAKLTDAEKDYHTENGSLINNIPPHLLPKDLRTAAKQVGFGLPYGLSDFGLCERTYSEINQINLIKTRLLIDKFTKVNHVFMDSLLKDRAMARIDADIPQSLRDFLGLEEDDTIAMVYNPNGFYRYQVTTNMKGDEGRLKSVERAFGNYPIQSYAADLFKVIYCRLHKRIRKDGMQDYFRFHLPVHDEVLASAHKSVNPDYILKIIREECIVRLKGHTPYYLGLNFGENWKECKSDASELPVNFVKRRAKEVSEVEKFAYCDSPSKYFKPMVLSYKKDRVFECLQNYRPNMIKDNLLNLDNILDDFENYTVRGYTFDIPKSFIPKADSNKPKEDDSNYRTLSSIVTVLAERIPDMKYILDGTLYTTEEILELNMRAIVDDVDLDDEDIISMSDLEFDDDDEDILDGMYEEDEEETFFSFDDGDSPYDFYIYVNAPGLTPEEEIKKAAKEVTDFKPDSYDYVSKLGKRVSIEVPTPLHIIKVVQALSKYRAKNGSSLIVKSGRKFEAPTEKYDLPDLKELDALVASIVSVKPNEVKNTSMFKRN